jgi:hypothetical protein
VPERVFSEAVHDRSSSRYIRPAHKYVHVRWSRYNDRVLLCTRTVFHNLNNRSAISGEKCGLGDILSKGTAEDLSETLRL